MYCFELPARRDLSNCGRRTSQSPTIGRIKGFVVVIPCRMPERTGHRGCTADADELIAALERVITKKQAIKQGMMQQLLTGRTRLPGFTEMEVRPTSVLRQGWNAHRTWSSSSPELHEHRGSCVRLLHEPSF